MWCFICTFFDKLISDTLKKEGKWSTTLLTMATAWYAILFTYLVDFIKNGLNEAAFAMILSVALGAKITNSISNKIENNPKDPNQESDGKN